jgi:T4 RnlA family RNA ligase
MFDFLKKLFRKNMNLLPTYEDCRKMCERKNSPFYEMKTVVDGFPVSLFNYRLANNSDFDTKHAKEMRGITFVFNTDGSLFKRYVLLEKFFNMNQTEESSYDKVKKYKIKFVNNKEDGSIASFIKLPNGKVVGRSKMGFTNDQALGINRVYRSNSLVREFVNEMLDLDIVPIFEYVAPTNRIVLKYNNEELILLKLRDNATGKHLDIKEFTTEGLKVANFESGFNSIDDLIEMVKNSVDKEGVIVQSEMTNGEDFFFKLKTPWYIELHGLLTEDVFRENKLINLILDEKVDDVLGQIGDDVELRNRIFTIMNIVKSDVRERESEIMRMYSIFEGLNFNKKQFALEHLNGNKSAAMALQLLKGKNSFDLAKSDLRENTKKLTEARNWLKSKDKSLLFNHLEEE